MDAKRTDIFGVASKARNNAAKHARGACKGRQNSIIVQTKVTTH
jgi:hypothetical protein